MFFLYCKILRSCGTINAESCRKEGDALKKVMLLASENMCGILQTALDDKYRTLPCSNLAAGREFLQTKPDILILELSLPGADGLTFLNDFANLLPDAILILTVFINDELLYDLEQAGVSAILRIPFSLAHLEDQLTDLIKKNPSR